MKKGFTLVELLVGISIIGIMAATISLSANSTKASARIEAERIAVYLNTQIKRADLKRYDLVINFSKNGFSVGSDDFKSFCTLIASKDVVKYDPFKNTFDHPVSFRVVDSNNRSYNVRISERGIVKVQ